MTSRIVTRLTIPIAAVSALLLGLAVVSAWYIQDMQERASGPIVSSVASMTAARELEISAREVSVQCNRYLITHDEKYLGKVPELKHRIQLALENAKSASFTPAEKDLVRQIEEGYAEFYQEYDNLINSPFPPLVKYPSIYDLTDNVLTKRILEPAHEYLRLNEEMLKQAN